MTAFRTAWLAAVALGATMTSAQAQTGPVPTTAEARWFKLGALQLASLHDADFVAANDGKTFGVDVGPAAVTKALVAAGAPGDRLAISVNALLVRLPGHLVLIDTGLGPKAHGMVADSLRQAGVTAADVTDVLITHTHGDHAGGLVTADGKPAFPKAVVRMATKEWASLQSQPGAKDLVTVITPQVQTFEPGAPLLPGITPIAIEGHTPGHVGYEIASGKARLLDIGDTAHSFIISLADPDWSMGFDADKAVGKASRRATLARLAASHELVFSPHFPYPGVGRIVTAGTGFSWQPNPSATFSVHP